MEKTATATVTTGNTQIAAAGVRTVFGRATVDARRQCAWCQERKSLEYFDEHSPVCLECSEARG